MHEVARKAKKPVLAPPPGCGYSLGNVFPGYANNAYPGLMYLHASGVASPKGCRELSPGWSVFCDTRGYSLRGNCTPAGVRGLFCKLRSMTAATVRDLCKPEQGFEVFK